VVQKQSLRFAHRPDHGIDRVTAQLLERRHPLIAVDDHVMIGLFGGDHHDRGLLAAGRKRSQQAPVTLRPLHPKVLQTAIKLVPFQPHRARSLDHSSLHQNRSAFARGSAEVGRHPHSNQLFAYETAFARCPAEV
jgi:hypothetical protein